MQLRFYNRDGLVFCGFVQPDNGKEPPATIQTKQGIYDHRTTLLPQGIYCYYLRRRSLHLHPGDITQIEKLQFREATDEAPPPP